MAAPQGLAPLCQVPPTLLFLHSFPSLLIPHFSSTCCSKLSVSLLLLLLLPSLLLAHMHVTRSSCMCTHGKQARTQAHTHKERRAYTNGYHLPILFVSLRKKEKRKKKNNGVSILRPAHQGTPFFLFLFFRFFFSSFFVQLHSRTPSRTIITVSPFPANNEANEKL